MVEERLKELNNSMNQMMDGEERFTEKHRQAIRQKIAKQRIKNPASLRANWKPVLSTAVSLLLILAIVQIAMDNMKSDYSMSSESADKAESGESAGLTVEKSQLEDAESDEGADASVPEEKLHQDSTNGSGHENITPPLDKDVVKAQINEPVLPIDDALKSVYENLKETGNQKALANLQPFQVMQIYYHAEQLGDHETQYMMYYQNPAGSMPSKKMYLDQVESNPVSPAVKEKKMRELKSVDSFEVTYEEDISGIQQAYVTWGGTGEDMKFFRLIKDPQQKIWTVSYQANQ
ncbi:hypothetical protein [Pseudalkalibacillus sp. SCS-8]|uniref:hypothetical protein n=1 Tax=Pseudalkalibacillus nanhaiensis TaxID=3115291 RepID=UPI0032DB7C1B